MPNRVLRQITPPLVKRLMSREGMSFAGSCVMTKLYSITKGKSEKALFYDELLDEIRKEPDIEQIFPEKKFKEHYIYCDMRNTLDHPDLYINQIRYYRMLKYFQKQYPDMFDKAATILDVGDTSGLLLEGMGRLGTSLNINQECVDYIQKKGIKAVLGNAERMDFEDDSFDYCFCFQCLEHLPNPIAALNELGRVARKKVFVSIPLTRQTNIYDVDYWIGQRKRMWGEENPRDVDCHIFEFSTEDFLKILSYTNLEHVLNFPIDYFNGNEKRSRLLNRRFGSYFNFFELKPKREGE